MIIDKIFSLVINAITSILNLFTLPSIPEDLLSNGYNFLDTIFTNVSLLGLFIRINTLKITAVLLIILFNFQHIYNLTMWLLKKIPFLNKT